MQKIQKLGIGIGLLSMSLILLASAMAADPQVDRRRFESVGSVDSIAPYNGRVVINGKKFRLAKNVQLFGLKGAYSDVPSALFSIRDRHVGYALSLVEGKQVVTAIMVLPEE